MFIGILGLLLIALVYAPQLWIRYVLYKHHKTITDMPGTGGELAQHLIERFELNGVKVMEGQANGDHYNPETQTVCLSPKVYRGKSLSAVAVATHEVGHALQFYRQEPVSKLRMRYMKKVFIIRRIGTVLMVGLSLIAAVVHIPHIMLLAIICGAGTMLLSVLMYVAILPEEFDASFNKALPILQEGYVPKEHMGAVRTVLKAAAYTYVAGALVEVISFWRWLRLLR